MNTQRNYTPKRLIENFHNPISSSSAKPLCSFLIRRQKKSEFSQASQLAKRSTRLLVCVYMLASEISPPGTVTLRYKLDRFPPFDIFQISTLSITGEEAGQTYDCTGHVEGAFPLPQKNLIIRIASQDKLKFYNGAIDQNRISEGQKITKLEGCKSNDDFVKCESCLATEDDTLKFVADLLSFIDSEQKILYREDLLQKPFAIDELKYFHEAIS
ncbi:hypothetical protein pdam_00003276 [Pocillopora damicornis]|uniref:Uncharacterized protein n=1 Tax=Pocillopora damicornis TaxID=46731 RepID=A0A3M6TI81_POCDA|nr:hypothetical protein pdam_00003276 [Pocillopora damicornis]